MEGFKKKKRVEFTVEELLNIHKIVSKEINSSKSEPYEKVNELMKISGKIEKATSKEIAWI